MGKRSKTKRLTDPRVAKAISSFVPEQVFERVIRHPDKLDRVGERRPVTAMFVDIAGFTPLCEGRDAEDVMSLLNALFKRILEAVSKYGGTVDKFMGDAAVILFGAPVVHEDDPIRALAASLEIIESVGELHGLNVSIGINTGEVVAGIVGNESHREYTVIGDAVNTASRLQNAAKPGEILVGEETYINSKQHFAFGKPQKLVLKGKKEMAVARPLLSAKTFKKTRTIPQLVGRGKVLDKLTEIITSPDAAVGFIVGEAGAGKTVLLGHLKEKAASLKIRTIEMSALPWGKNIPYGPVQPLIRSILGSNPRNALEKLLPSESEYFALLSGLIGIEIPPTDKTRYLSPIEKREILHILLLKLIASRFGTDRLLIVIDNSETLDPSSADLIATMAPILKVAVVCAGRNTGGIDQRFTTNQIKSVFVRLRNLSRDNVRALVRAKLAASRVSRELVEEIISETGGNPGHIVELLQLLVSKNRIVKRRGVCYLEDTVEKGLPHDTEGILTARVDSLPPDAREVLRFASVLGHEFPRKLLMGLLGRDIATKGINQLSERDLVERLDGNLRFFSVPLLKAAYNSLLVSARRELHRLAANEIIESLKSRIEDYYEDLARHFEAGSVPKEAFRYQILSGRKQERRFANQEALYYYEKALAIADDQVIEWGLWKELFGALESAGRLYWYSGELRKVVELNTRAKKIAERMGKITFVTDAINRIALAHQELGHLKKAKALYTEQLEILVKLGGERERLLQALVNLGTLLSDSGDLDGAREVYERGLKVAGRAKKSWGAANLLGNLGWLECQVGNPGRAEKLLLRSQRIDNALGNLRGLAINSVNLAQVYRAGGKKMQEIESYERALELFRKIGDRRGEALCLSNLGDTSRETGDFEKAISLHKKARKLAKELGDPLRTVDAELGLALDIAATGSMESAIRRAKEALALTRKTGDWEGEIEVGLELLRMLKDNDNRISFNRLKKDLEKTIKEFNPSAMSRLEKIE